MMSEVTWDTAQAALLWNDPVYMGTTEIAKRLGISKNTLCGWAQRHRTEFPKRTEHNYGINTYTAKERASLYRHERIRQGAARNDVHVIVHPNVERRPQPP